MRKRNSHGRPSEWAYSQSLHSPSTTKCQSSRTHWTASQLLFLLDVYFSSLQNSLTAFKLLLHLTENNYKDLCQSEWAAAKERRASWKDSLSLARPVTPGQLCSLPVCGLGAAFAPDAEPEAKDSVDAFSLGESWWQEEQVHISF